MRSKQVQLTAQDFPLQAVGDTIMKRDGSVAATASSADIAAEMVDRLNRDQDKHHEDSWSA